MNQSSVATPERASFRPLYSQIKALLVKRIGSGAWKPGELLPSEFELALEYKVSQGTVRKALTALEADRLIVRRQGRGTYVARHTRENALFHFFRMVGPDDKRLTPASVVLSQKTQAAKPEQAADLSVEPGTKLHALIRVRHFGGTPMIFEQIFVPADLMPGLAVKVGVEMDDEMYVIYEEVFGISIARASERLAAVVVTAREAKHLRLEPGAPILEIVRVACDVSGSPVELRISRCNTHAARYAAEVY